MIFYKDTLYVHAKGNGHLEVWQTSLSTTVLTTIGLKSNTMCYFMCYFIFIIVRRRVATCTYRKGKHHSLLTLLLKLEVTIARKVLPMNANLFRSLFADVM